MAAAAAAGTTGTGTTTRSSTSVLLLLVVILHVGVVGASSWSPSSTSLRRHRGAAAARSPRAAPGVTLRVDDYQHQIVVDNGVVQVTLSKPQGHITGVGYNGEHNLLQYNGTENSGGYWDVVWNYPGSGSDQPTGMIDMLDSTEFKVVISTEEQVELSFTSTYNPSRQDSLRLNVDKRLVMLKGNSGFYCYSIFEHASDCPALNITEARLVFKLNTDKTSYRTSGPCVPSGRLTCTNTGAPGLPARHPLTGNDEVKVEATAGEVNPEAIQGFDICGTDPDPTLFSIQGEPPSEVCLAPCCMTIIQEGSEEE